MQRPALLRALVAIQRTCKLQRYFATSSADGGVYAEYERMVASGELRPDASQQAAAQALQLLQSALAARLAERAQPHAAREAVRISDDGGGSSVGAGGAGGVGGATAAAPPRPGPKAAGAAAGATAAPAPVPTPAVQGAYLWGPVGSGKTLLMDTFARTLPAGARARRLHLHQLLAHMHERSHQLQEALPRIVVKSRLGLPVYRYALPEEDFIEVIARELAASCDVLCVDELHLADVADALALGRLLAALLRRGCWAAFTSNRPARDLYKGGINRQYLKHGFVELCDHHLLQIRVAGGTDHRTAAARGGGGGGGGVGAEGGDGRSGEQGNAENGSGKGGGGSHYFSGAGGAERLRRAWRDLVAASGGREGEASVALKFGREIWLPRALLLPGAAAAAAAGQQAGEAAGAPRHKGQLQGQQQQQQQQQQQHGRAPGAEAQDGGAGGRLAAAYFTFDQLCGAAGLRRGLDRGGPLSSVDCLALADCLARPGAVFLEGVPALGPAARDETRRLVTLVDVLYDAGVPMWVSAEVPPEELFLPLLGAALARGVNPNLGRAAKLPADRLLAARRRQEAESAAAAAAAAPPPMASGAGAAPGADGAGAAFGAPPGGVPCASGRDWGATEDSDGSYVEGALVAEEVLMYHRAASRLAEMTRGGWGPRRP